MAAVVGSAVCAVSVDDEMAVLHQHASVLSASCTGPPQPHLSDELRAGAGEPCVTLRVDLEGLLMVA